MAYGRRSRRQQQVPEPEPETEGDGEFEVVEDDGLAVDLPDPFAADPALTRSGPGVAAPARDSFDFEATVDFQPTEGAAGPGSPYDEATLAYQEQPAFAQGEVEPAPGAFAADFSDQGLGEVLDFASGDPGYDQNVDFDDNAATLDFGQPPRAGAADFQDGAETLDFGGAAGGQDFAADFQDGAETLDFGGAHGQPGTADVDFEAEAEGPAAGSQRGRRSRRDRVSERSSKRSSQRSSRRVRVFSEEELEERRQGRRLGILVGLVVVVILGLAVGFYFLFLRTDDRLKEVRAHLRSAQEALVAVEGALTRREADEAETLKDHAIRTHLQIPVFGHADGSPNPDDPQIYNIKLAYDAHDLLKRLQATERDIKRIRQDNQAGLNFRHLIDQFGNLANVVDLDELERTTRAFIDNPVEPEAGPDQVLSNRYSNFVVQVQNRLVSIDQERNRRKAAATTDVVSQTLAEVDTLKRKERYGEALRLIDETSRRNPEADFTQMRSGLLKAANAAWLGARKRAIEEHRTATDLSNPPAVRQAALERSHAALQQVIDHFGGDVEAMADYVAEAREMLRQFGG